MSFSSRSDSTALLSWEGLIFYYQLRGFMNNSKLKQIFENLISLVEEKKWYGACHDISAVFYILAKEVGFEPTLLIGEVRNPATGSYFDHSWVCIDEKIYDVAIGYPNHGIDPPCAPIFMSKDLITDKEIDMEFGFHSEHGLDDTASKVSKWTLREYDLSLIHISEPTRP